MNKPIADLWSMTQMLVEEAVLAEREACAKVCDDNYFAIMAADAIRARGQA